MQLSHYGSIRGSMNDAAKKNEISDYSHYSPMFRSLLMAIPGLVGILRVTIELYVENNPFNHEHDGFQNCTMQSKKARMEHP